jgi:hypothetical protein
MDGHITALGLDSEDHFVCTLSYHTHSIPVSIQVSSSDEETIYFKFISQNFISKSCLIPKQPSRKRDSNILHLYSPSGFAPVPFLGVGPGLDDIVASAPPPLPDKPSGFLFVPARGPDAPVTSLRELPYSRTTSPQVRVELVTLLPSATHRRTLSHQHELTLRWPPCLPQRLRFRRLIQCLR